MPDILYFTLVGTEYFCIPINIFDFCSEIQLHYLETIWHFQILFFRFIRQAQRSIQPRANYSPLLRQYLSDYAIQWCMNHKFSSLAGGNRHQPYSQPYVSSWNLLSNLSGNFFPQPRVVFWHTCTDRHLKMCLKLKGPPQKVSGLLFSAASLQNSALQTVTAFVSPASQFYLLSLQGPRAPFGFPVPAQKPENVFKAVNWCNYSAYFLLSQSLRYHKSSISDRQCFNNLCFLYFANF